MMKCPLDLWIYHEIIWDIRPAIVIETGTAYGGSAVYLAEMCDLTRNGEVITIDPHVEPDRPQHPRLTYLVGSSIDPTIVGEVKRRVTLANGPVLVILDSDHGADHVSAELEAYAPLVTPESFLIVEDTNLNGHPVASWFGPGPAEAVVEFLAKHPEFVQDDRGEAPLMTFNPGGYLRRRTDG